MAQLTFQKIGYVGVIQVDRPEALNALNRDIIDALDVELDKIAADPEVRVLVIGGTPNFAAGADIKSMVECDPEGAKKFSFSPTYHKLMNLAIPTICGLQQTTPRWVWWRPTWASSRAPAAQFACPA